MLGLVPGTTLALVPDILLRSLPSQGVFYAFNVATGDHFRLNRSSYWILENIGDGVEFGELQSRFLDTFDVLPNQGIADLETIASQLFQERIVRRISIEEEKDGL